MKRRESHTRTSSINAEDEGANTQASRESGRMEMEATTIPYSGDVPAPIAQRDESASSDGTMDVPDYIREFFDWDRYCEDYDEDSVDWTGRVDWSGSRKGK